MELKATQKVVLKVLVDNEGKWFNCNEIYNICKVNRSHINSAIKFFVDNDYVYMPNSDGKVTVSPDGISAYYSS